MNTDSASHDAQTGGTNVPPDARPSGTTERVSDERLAEILAWYVNWQPCAEDPGLSRMEADAISLFRELQRLRSSGGACDSPLAAGDAFVAAFKREPKDPADLAWMNGYAAGRRAPEPRGKPVPCWCPYCEQPHTPRIQEADPSPPTKPCSCQDTTESACGVAQGSVLGKLWHCRRSQLTKDGKL